MANRPTRAGSIHKGRDSQATVAAGRKCEDVACRRAAEAFFSCLDRSCGGHGSVDQATGLKVWRCLTQDLDGARIRSSEQQLRNRTEPILRDQWLILTDTIWDITGTRMFMSSLLRSWVLLEEGKLKADVPTKKKPSSILVPLGCQPSVTEPEREANVKVGCQHLDVGSLEKQGRPLGKSASLAAVPSAIDKQPISCKEKSRSVPYHELDQVEQLLDDAYALQKKKRIKGDAIVNALMANAEESQNWQPCDDGSGSQHRGGETLVMKSTSCTNLANATSPQGPSCTRKDMDCVRSGLSLLAVVKPSRFEDVSCISSSGATMEELQGASRNKVDDPLGSADQQPGAGMLQTSQDKHCGKVHQQALISGVFNDWAFSCKACKESRMFSVGHDAARLDFAARPPPRLEPIEIEHQHRTPLPLPLGQNPFLDPTARSEATSSVTEVAHAALFSEPKALAKLCTQLAVPPHALDTVACDDEAQNALGVIAPGSSETTKQSGQENQKVEDIGELCSGSERLLDGASTCMPPSSLLEPESLMQDTCFSGVASPSGSLTEQSTPLASVAGDEITAQQSLHDEISMAGEKDHVQEAVSKTTDHKRRDTDSKKKQKGKKRCNSEKQLIVAEVQEKGLKKKITSVVGSLPFPEKSRQVQRSISQPAMVPALVRPCLPPLPKVPIFVPFAVRLAQAVEAWKTQHFMYFRIGNVVKVNKDFSTGDMSIQHGARGRIVYVTHDVSVSLLLEDHSTAIEVLKKDMVHLELLVVTHEVELIDNNGHASGKRLCCIVLKDHEDGFFDILCQDGQKGLFVHGAFLHELPAAVYSDVGYCSLSGKTSPTSDNSDDPHSVSLKREESISTKRAAVSYELPPAAYQGLASGFGIASPSAAVRSRTLMGKRQDESRREDLPHVDMVIPTDSSALDVGAQICPFMEIQDGGLRAVVALCNFTCSDTVVDIGCGHGKILKMILQSFPCRGIGVEVNWSIARVAEHQLRRYGKRASVVVDDVRNVDLHAATATVSFMLSHSFEAQGKALKEHMSKSLQPGCVVLNYCYPVLGWRGSYYNGVWKYIIGEHLPEE